MHLLAQSGPSGAHFGPIWMALDPNLHLSGAWAGPPGHQNGYKSQPWRQGLTNLSIQSSVLDVHPSTIQEYASPGPAIGPVFIDLGRKSISIAYVGRKNLQIPMAQQVARTR